LRYKKKMNPSELKSASSDIISRYNFDGNPFESVRSKVIHKGTFQIQITNNIIDGVETFIFTSPNACEDLKITEALTKFDSRDQVLFHLATAEFAKILDVEISTADILGDWDTGVENSLLTVVKSGISSKQAFVLAAYQGKLSRQLSIAIFQIIKTGIDHIYFVDVPWEDSEDLEGIRKSLTKKGIIFRSIILFEPELKVISFDERGENLDKMGKFADLMEVDKEKRILRKGIATIIEHIPESRSGSQGLFTKTALNNMDDLEQFSILEETNNSYKRLFEDDSISGKYPFLEKPILSSKAVEYMRLIFKDDELKQEDCLRILKLQK